MGDCSSNKTQKQMNLKKTAKICVGAAVFSLMVTSANAVTINDSGVIGTVRPGIPSGQENQVAYVNSLIDLANSQGAHKTSSGGNPLQSYATGALLNVPSGLEHVTSEDSSDSGDIPNNPTLATLTIPAGWDYVLAKFGGGQNGGGDVVWYLGGEGMTLPANSLGMGWTTPAKAALPNKKNNGTNNDTSTETAFGLSHFTLYSEHQRDVPDSGATVALLGMGMVGLGMMRRKLS
jgi:hypothetical protein